MALEIQPKNLQKEAEEREFCKAQLPVLLLCCWQQGPFSLRLGEPQLPPPNPPTLTQELLWLLQGEWEGPVEGGGAPRPGRATFIGAQYVLPPYTWDQAPCLPQEEGRTED